MELEGRGCPTVPRLGHPGASQTDGRWHNEGRTRRNKRCADNADSGVAIQLVGGKIRVGAEK